MKKVKKDDLDDLTKAVIDTGIIAAALLACLGCPVPEIFERIEHSVRDADAMRLDLDLESIAPDELTQGKLSKMVTEAVGKAQEAYRAKVGDEKIKSDLSKMN